MPSRGKKSPSAELRSRAPVIETPESPELTEPRRRKNKKTRAQRDLERFSQERQITEANKISGLFRDYTFYCIMLVLSTAVIQNEVGAVIKKPYMDEEFHVPQAMRFCEGNYTHDPKITTLPGLYHFTLFFRSLSQLLSAPGSFLEFTCSLGHLRNLNLLVNSINYFLFYQILTHYMDGRPASHICFTAFVLSLFPLQYFFSFLYYTDQISTMGVLMMHALYLRKNYAFSAVAGAFAVFTRQTNILWVGWHIIHVMWDAGISFIPLIFPNFNATVRNGLSPMYYYYKVIQFLENSLSVNRRKDKRLTRSNLIMFGITDAIYKSMAYITVCLFFVAFVINNGGIAVGDKGAHYMTANIPQLGYFAIFVLFFGMSHFAFRLGSLLESFAERTSLWIACWILGIGVVKLFTYSHEYTLADNRHYTFYIWKRLINQPLFKIVLVGPYLFTWFSIFKLAKQHLFLKLAFFFVVAASTVPNRLFELRYFIIPYYFWRFSTHSFELREVALEFLVYLFVNMYTIYKFIYSPFKWENSNDDQRFMW